MATSAPRREATADVLDGFETLVKDALELCHAPALLGEHSRLAQPFFLGALLAAHANPTPAQRGEALVAALRATAAGLDSPDARTLLNAYAFQREHVYSKRAGRLQPRVNNTGVAQRLNMSERTFYRERDAAIKQLARSLLNATRPALAGERPAERWMAGRDAVLRRMLDALKRRRTVSLVGNSGSGKTTLAGAVARALGSQDVFWHTLRAGVNDTPSALLFAIGHFLRDRGAPATWRQMLADQGAAKFERVLGALRHDLATLGDRLPVFTIDDVEILQPELSAHLQVVQVLDELGAHAALLLIGQRQVADTHDRIELAGFTRDEFDDWASGAGMGDVDAATLERLLAATHGNPGLLSLFRALHASGADLAALLREGGALPSAEVMFDRVCRRLGPDALALLFTLAVCHSPLPTEALGVAPEAVDALQGRDLVTRGEFGALDVSPFVRRLAAARAPHVLPAGAHQALAAIYESYGNVVSAMHHWIEAGRPELAVWHWHMHADGEVNRGRTAAALAQLSRIAAHALADPRDRAALSQHRGRLEVLVGLHDAAEEDLRQVGASAPAQIRARAQVLLGTLMRTQGRDGEALQHYRAAVETVDAATARSRVSARFAMGYVLHAHEGSIDQARQQAVLALCDAHVMNADLAAQLGRFDDARAHYASALALVEGRPAFEAEACRALSGLGSLLWQMGDPAGASAALERAIAIDRRRGSVWQEANDLNTLCAVQITAGQHAQALSTAAEAMPLATRLGDPWLVSVLEANMAEAHLNLGGLDEADALIARSLARGQIFIRPLALTLLGVWRARQGKPGEAERALRDAIACAIETERPYQEAMAVVELGRVQAARGQTDAARDSLNLALERFEGMHLSADAARVQRLIADSNPSA